jgi:hypothetical protein
MYDTNNNLVEHLGQYWDGSISDWVNNDKYSNIYDGNNNQIKSRSQIWGDSIWVNYYKYSKVYDGNNNLKEYLHQNWADSVWVDYYRELYTYDVNNNQTEILRQYKVDSNWSNYYKVSYMYDINNKLKEELRQDWVGTWVNEFNFFYVYDENSNRIELLQQKWVNSTWVNTVKFLYTYIPVTSAGEELNPINSYSLSNNYPNPFNPTTSIQYAIGSRQFVSLKVYNILGTEIETLVNEEKSAGNYELNWNAANLPSGVYFYKLQAGDFVQTKKMILLK